MFKHKNFKLIIGLGNNGAKYEYTYHNVGFLAVDALQKKEPLPDIPIIKISGFMNEAGKTVLDLIRKYHINPETLLVIQDDVDLALGTYKLQYGRGSAGHKGVQNIIDVLGTKNFWRLRIGIQPLKSISTSRKKAEEFVLKNISKTNLKTLQKVFKKITEEIR